MVGTTVVLVVLVGAGTGGADDVGAAAFDPPEHAARIATATAVTRANVARARRGRCWRPMTVLWAVLLIGVAGGLLWLATRFEPHWSAADGSRFTCRVQEIDGSGRPVSRWYDARAEVVDGKVVITKKVLMRRGTPVDPRAVSARSDDAPRRTRNLPPQRRSAARGPAPDTVACGDQARSLADRTPPLEREPIGLAAARVEEPVIPALGAFGAGPLGPRLRLLAQALSARAWWWRTGPAPSRRSGPGSRPASRPGRAAAGCW